MQYYRLCPAQSGGRIFCFALLVCLTKAYSQSSFNFLDAPANARLEALGGQNVSSTDEDVGLFFSNPALVGDSLSGVSAATVKFFPSGIAESAVSFASTFNRVGLLMFGIQHISYGEIDSYDETGAYLGTYRSGETALVIGKSHQVGNFRLGLNLKGAFSAIAGYHASALGFDLGGVFVHPKQDLHVGLAIENPGIILNEYSETSDTNLPLDVKAGVTYKPAHMPARFIFTAYNMATTRRDTINGRTNEQLSPLDKAFGHLNMGMELLLGPNFNVLFGYNFLRHQQLSLENGGGLSGFSLGVNGKINSFEFVLARSSYFAGQAGYSFTIAVNWNDILR